MRIAHVTATFPPYSGGQGHVCFYSARELARRGHSVTVFTAAHPPGEYTYPSDIDVRRLPPLFRIGNAPFLPDLLKIKGFDLIHLHYPFIFGAEMVWAVSRVRSIPFVLTYHNDLIGAGFRRYLFSSYSAISYRLAFGGAAKCIVVSRGHAENSLATPLLQRRGGDVIEIPNGVALDLFRPGIDGAVIRQKLNISVKANVILFVGVLDRAHHFKGLELLLRAFASLDPCQAVLLVVGDGDLKAGYIALAEELGILMQTRFVGAIPHADLPSYFATSDLVVLPSFPPESFGMVLIEGMACGKPVIANDIPGVRSVVANRQDGLLAVPGDIDDLAEKMQLLLESQERREELGRNGRAKVEEYYSWENIGDRLEVLYQQVTANPRVN